MKKLMFALVASTATFVYAEEAKVDAKAEVKPAAEKVDPAELEKEDAPILWGFGNFGFYSGYQLYGSILNPDPVLQGYIEANVNLPWSVGPLDDLGYFGAGFWCNSDLTGRRDHSMRRAFNEDDPNVHWGKTFWFDEKKEWGLDYRMAVIWYYYPHTTCGHSPTTGHRRSNIQTTMDWDHFVTFVNPYVQPYINWIHEYEQTNGNLLQFGIKKPWQITDELSVCPFIELVWRDHWYGWCFSNYGLDENGNMQSAGLATLKLELDATYMFTPNFGIFAKVAYCQNLDPHMRESCDLAGKSQFGDAYGYYNEYCWGGVGVCINF